jgi:hypothetical protein
MFLNTDIAGYESLASKPCLNKHADDHKRNRYHAVSQDPLLLHLEEAGKVLSMIVDRDLLETQGLVQFGTSTAQGLLSLVQNQ